MKTLITKTLFFFFLIACGCSQASGDFCKVNQDCEDPLICCYQAINGEYGHCTEPDNCNGDAGIDDIQQDSDTNFPSG
ncbi:MAG: hypothetical protein PF689_00315 [Deltaproteobacteria bacterium]|jgi:hypothetical protein|nr:hypothetical protein [Deltaproteobacteria bacterium]